MKNKFDDSKRANHIGFVIADIIICIGAALILCAQIEIASESEKSYWLYEDLLMMSRYGLAIGIGGLFAAFGCVFNLKKIEKENGDEEKICDLCNNACDKLHTVHVGDEELQICSQCAEKSIPHHKNKS